MPALVTSAETPNSSEPEVPEANETSEQATGRPDRVLVVLLCLLLAYLLLLITTFGYGRDQGIYALVGRTIHEGGMPYRDAWDFKPPGIYLVYALARTLFGRAELGIRLLEAGGLAATAWGMLRLSQRWWGEWRIGLMAGVITALVHAQLEFWHSGQPETFGGMLGVAGIVVVTRRGGPRWWSMIGCGVLFGAAGLLKPPLAGGGAVVALWLAWRVIASSDAPDLRQRLAACWRRALAPIGLVLVGGLLPFALCLGWFAAKGALEALYDTLFVFTPHYTALGWKDRTLQGLCYQALTQWLVTYSSVTTVGLLLSLASWRRVWVREGTGLLLAVIAMQLFGVALQGKFFPYHYAACWPLTALLAALGWWWLWRAAAARGRLAIAGFALFVAVTSILRTASKDVPKSFWHRAVERTRVLVAGGSDQTAIDRLESVADVNAEGNRAVASELRARVPEGGYVYIWGFEPHIYDMAERPFSSRYIYNVPQRVEWAAKATRAELLRHLSERPPVAIVVTYHDVFPMVTGDAIGSADVMENKFPELKAFVEAGYGKLKRVNDFDIYLKR